MPIKTEVFSGYGAGNEALDKKLNEIGKGNIINLSTSIDGRGNTAAILVYEYEEKPEPPETVTGP